MSDKIKIPELEIEVDDIEDFNEQASEILEDFCLDLEKQGETRVPTEEDIADENCLFMWSDKAVGLIDAEIGRLYQIGYKYFDQSIDLDISTSMYKEI